MNHATSPRPREHVESRHHLPGRPPNLPVESIGLRHSGEPIQLRIGSAEHDPLGDLLPLPQFYWTSRAPSTTSEAVKETPERLGNRMQLQVLGRITAYCVREELGLTWGVTLDVPYDLRSFFGRRTHIPQDDARTAMAEALAHISKGT